jgi:alpha-L-fucosidase
MTQTQTDRTRWESLKRQTPAWFRRAPFGIFIHWGAYSVPAWAEPTGELGAVDDREWFVHNAYAEWYANTIRIEGSPAQRHHQDEFGGADYDELLDRWTAENFDAGELMDLVAGAGADYVVPTTKHHDGIALWDAPGTGTRNTVHRGPHRDLIGEISQAAKARGIRLGLYYSGGLDWHVRPMPAHLSAESVSVTGRPQDAEYAAYASAHVRDLIDRYDPSVLWNDIEWPDAGKHFGEDGLGSLFEYFYSRRPDGVVNDRWGDTHHDYATSEYQNSLESESEEQWENCRGIGLSFGYNQVEGPEHSLDGAGIARHLTDVVSRGGRLLLNVGPKADGTLPENQRAALEQMARWMTVAKPLLTGTVPSEASVTAEDGWARTVLSEDGLTCFVDRPDGSAGTVELHGLRGRAASVEPSWGEVTVQNGDHVVISLAAGRPGPVVLRVEDR